MTLVTTTIADDDAPSPAMGDLGKFRIKKLTKLVKPLMSIAKPLLSMGQGGGGLLTAMGPWGWAAGAALAAGGALAAKHRKKKQRAKQRQAEQTAMEAPQAMPAPGYGYPPAMMDQGQPAEAMTMPDGYSAPSPDMPGPGAMTLPESPPAEWSVPGSDVAMPYPAAEQPPEFQAVLDPEMPPPAVDGLAADGQPAAPLDWRTVAFIAGLGLGGWWLLSNHKPTRSKRR